MAISVFDMFRIGIGPSSSHTVGPMRAARRFIEDLRAKGVLDQTERVSVRLLGSLAATGKGHATDNAVMIGLMDEAPDTVDIDTIEPRIREIEETKTLLLAGIKKIAFDPVTDLTFHPTEVDSYHTNTIHFAAFDAAGNLLFKEKIYSPGGGFIEAEADILNKNHHVKYSGQEVRELPYPFKNAKELIDMCKEHNMTIAQIVFRNELAWRSEEEVNYGLDNIATVMHNVVERGLHAEGVLPGALKVKRRAPRLYEQLKTLRFSLTYDPLQIIDWINLWAFAAAEENAAGGRVVTAPTNGACGIIPAVLEYYLKLVPHSSREGVRDFLLTAGAIGMIYKRNASISGAEVGCQGEVGVACSMAAAALTAVLGGTPEQVENAAEIGMEHFLGLTCDPVRGQVQIPCIERNAIAAVKALNAVRMALRGDGSHFVSLDQVVRTMLETGRDMQAKYKETSLGGLAVSIVEC